MPTFATEFDLGKLNDQIFTLLGFLNTDRQKRDGGVARFTVTELQMSDQGDVGELRFNGEFGTTLDKEPGTAPLVFSSYLSNGWYRWNSGRVPRLEFRLDLPINSQEILGDARINHIANNFEVLAGELLKKQMQAYGEIGEPSVSVEREKDRRGNVTHLKANLKINIDLEGLPDTSPRKRLTPFTGIEVDLDMTRYGMEVEFRSSINPNYLREGGSGRSYAYQVLNTLMQRARGESLKPENALVIVKIEALASKLNDLVTSFLEGKFPFPDEDSCASSLKVVPELLRTGS